DKVGCREGDLLCGPPPPLSEQVARDYATRGFRLTAVYSNCSGKHAGMLALARNHGWPTEFYTRPEHPVQQRCLREVSRWTDVPVGDIRTATDGCGVVCFGIPLRRMALAYARLANAELGMRNAESTGEVARSTTLADPFRIPHSALRIVESMLRHPDLIAGEGRPCTEMMRAHPGRVVVKVGAEGVYCALLPRDGLGVAIKVADGHALASALALAAVLEQLGLRPRPASLTAWPLVNTRGEPVGELRVNGGLEQQKDGGPRMGEEEYEPGTARPPHRGAGAACRGRRRRRRVRAPAAARRGPGGGCVVPVDRGAAAPEYARGRLPAGAGGVRRVARDGRTHGRGRARGGAAGARGLAGVGGSG